MAFDGKRKERLEEALEVFQGCQRKKGGAVKGEQTTRGLANKYIHF